MHNPAIGGRAPLGDDIFRWLCLSAATLLLAILAGVVVSLAIGGWPAFAKFGLGFLTASTWNPVSDVYGAAGPIVGTLVTSFLSLAIALPLAIGVAVFLTEFAPARIARPIAVAVELLAGGDAVEGFARALVGMRLRGQRAVVGPAVTTHRDLLASHMLLDAAFGPELGNDHRVRALFQTTARPSAWPAG